ncbi:hypothetical protein M885DRAFT_531980 [Pelagophyceae sp. CCMP2097]|nr:hypothetical protein M885DRAFT_531980 [Pelagophyceae sp. CCMP2097]
MSDDDERQERRKRRRSEFIAAREIAARVAASGVKARVAASGTASFGAPETASGAAVGVPEPAAADDVAVAPIRELARLFVGTAGICGGLDRHQETLDYCELNSSTYGAPTNTAIQNWTSKCAKGFHLGLKAPKTITHDSGLDDCEAAEAFVASLKPLTDKGVLGPVLFQCPRGLSADVAKLRRLHAAVASDDLKVAVEFRHPSWHNPEVKAFLTSVNWALVDHPNSIGRATVGKQGDAQRDGSAVPYALDALSGIQTADWIYIRLHGNNDEHTYRHSDAELSSYAEQVHSLRGRPGMESVYVSFLNDDSKGAMLQNAQTFRNLVHALDGDAPPRAPKQPRRTIDSFFSPTNCKAR